jgi:hypothetical protein
MEGSQFDTESDIFGMPLDTERVLRKKYIPTPPHPTPSMMNDHHHIRFGRNGVKESRNLDSLHLQVTAS